MLNTQKTSQIGEVLQLGGCLFQISRPHPGFGLVIEGLITPTAEKETSSTSSQTEASACSDYLHQQLLNPEIRQAFFELIAQEGLVVCRQVDCNHPNYRKVRGKSSHQKLSQAEYYHHDGCSCPQNPRLVEIRLPYQEYDRNVATAIAPFPAVIQAMLLALPSGLQREGELNEFQARFRDSPFWDFDRQQYLTERVAPGNRDPNRAAIVDWDRMQGQLIRLVRKELNAESCRAYYREVDQLSGAYVLPWQMGESRLMLNFDPLPEITMQHRRAYQKQRDANECNGHLVKRWTAEELCSD